MAAWSEADAARLVELHGAGRSVGECAEALGFSKATISRRGRQAGLAWDRGQTATATTAKVRSNASRRAELVESLLDDAPVIRAAVMDAIGSLNARDAKDLAVTLGIVLDKALTLEKHDSDGGAAEAVSMLSALASSLGVTGPAQ